MKMVKVNGENEYQNLPSYINDSNGSPLTDYNMQCSLVDVEFKEGVLVKEIIIARTETKEEYDERLKGVDNRNNRIVNELTYVNNTQSTQATTTTTTTTTNGYTRAELIAMLAELENS